MKGEVFGLAPPSTVETMERCPNGVARVETQLSFLDQPRGTTGCFTGLAAASPDNYS